MKDTNWLAIVVAAIAGFFIGFLWYGLIFKNQWMAGNGITMEGESMFKNGAAIAMSNLPMIVNTIGMFLFALLLNLLINKTNSTTMSKGLTLGVVIGVVVAINIILSNLFAQNPLSLSIVDSSYIIVLLT